MNSKKSQSINETISMVCEMAEMEAKKKSNVIVGYSNKMMMTPSSISSSSSLSSSPISASSSSIYSTGPISYDMQHPNQQYPLSPPISNASSALSPTTQTTNSSSSSSPSSSSSSSLSSSSPSTNNQHQPQQPFSSNGTKQPPKQCLNYSLGNAAMTSQAAQSSKSSSSLLVDRDEYKINASMKPPYSYSQLIIMAMKESNKAKMTLHMIYDWIIEIFCEFQKGDAAGQITFKNSIRHNLSLNKSFKKIARQKDEPGKGGFWTLDPDFERKLNETSLSSPKILTSSENIDSSSSPSSIVVTTSTTPNMATNGNVVVKRRRTKSFMKAAAALGSRQVEATKQQEPFGSQQCVYADSSSSSSSMNYTNPTATSNYPYQQMTSAYSNISVSTTTMKKDEMKCSDPLTISYETTTANDPVNKKFKS